MRVLVGISAVALALTGCAGESAQTSRVETVELLDDGTTEKTVTVKQTGKPFPAAAVGEFRVSNLPAFFDCVREKDGMLIASHRAGPAPGYPENALETLQYARSKATVIHEIDVVESRDGVLFLLHDRTLGRTTTGDGMVADTDWADIANLNLVDNDGRVTDFNPPKLSDVLLWAKESGSILELDKKPTTSFRNIIEAVRETGTENNVVLITYNDDQATQVANLAPDLMLTASIDSRDHQAELEAAGVDMTKVIAWMGIRNPNPRAFRAVGSRGIETAFGTLGRPGNRLDDEYLADGDPSEYEALYAGGLTLLATDAVYEVSRALLADDIAMRECGVQD
ncbi:MAG: glycerophosphodiester phosphodiesterase family protein [Pseudomonadota bacterium]